MAVRLIYFTRQPGNSLTGIAGADLHALETAFFDVACSEYHPDHKTYHRNVPEWLKNNPLCCCSCCGADILAACLVATLTLSLREDPRMSDAAVELMHLICPVCYVEGRGGASADVVPCMLRPWGYVAGWIDDLDGLEARRSSFKGGFMFEAAVALHCRYSSKSKVRNPQAFGLSPKDLKWSG